MYKIAGLLLFVSVFLFGCLEPPVCSSPGSSGCVPPSPTATATIGPTPTIAVNATATIQVGQPRVIELKIYHTLYDPASITVHAGELITLLATSQYIAHHHGVTIDELGLNVDVQTPFDSTGTPITFTAPSTPGNYKIYCKTCYAGHPDIEATLVVQP